ncbi:ABC-2 type transport system ATP-binding protein [Selenomonas sp. WCT3]|uniref:ABC transporter ATP-binding protein n=1 Tax=unclassified Selenomonas TaxID=2637378 RepID=UPI000882FAA3|nr:ABC transporter ATP-binding protein [Selenomonas sp.]MCR5440408.1 ABC transporter ATP-binding protein [Selenomonas sp.]SDG24533.1 ABC-2 type transport system ATP-binding protein [Selenomonas ruminantium]
MSVLVEQVTCSRHGQVILRNVSLEMKTGEVMGLLGPNGAGKTTLIRLMAGLARPDAGHIRVFGEDAARRSVKFRRLIGLVPQENTFESELTIEQSMLCTAKLYGIVDARTRVEEVCRQFQIGSWRKKYPEKLSGGMKRRAMIARAMLPSPDVLLLDEPSVGLDPDMRQDIWQAVRNLKAAGKTVLLTTHYMEEAEELCDRIAFLRAGQVLYTGTTTGIRQQISPEQEISLEDAFLALALEGRRIG